MVELNPEFAAYQAALLAELDADRRAMLDRLAQLGWEPWHTGGGCWSLRLGLQGDCEALMTDGDLYFPTDGEWTFAILTGDAETVWFANNTDDYGRDGVTLDECLAKVEAFKASKLPEALFKGIWSRDDAEAWIEALLAAGMGWHFDDDPTQGINWADGLVVSDLDARLLKCQRDALYSASVGSWGPFECPIGYVLAVEACAAADPVDGETIGGDLRTRIASGEIAGYERLLKGARS